MCHCRSILNTLGFATLGLLLHAGTLQADDQCRELTSRFAGQPDHQPRRIEDLAPPSEYQTGKVFRQWRGGGEVPLQGWKIHVSASLGNTAEIAATILPKLREMNIPHKVAASTEAYKNHLVRPGDSTNTQAGKPPKKSKRFRFFVLQRTQQKFRVRRKATTR